MTVWTQPRDLSRGRTYLGTIGKVRSLEWETTLPGGPRSATWTMEVPAKQDPPELQQGVLVGISLGGYEIWTGDLSEPEPGDGNLRRFTADGLAVELSRYVAAAGNVYQIAGTGGVIAEARARGMRVRAGDVQNAPNSMTAPNDGTKTVDQAVNEVADLLGLTWQVNEGAVSHVPFATVPTHMVIPRGQGSRTLNDYQTHLFVRYNNTASTIAAFIETNNQDAYRGKREATLDLTGKGVLTEAQARVIAKGALKRSAPRTRYSSSIEVSPGEVFNLAGAPVDPRTLTAGHVLNIVGLDIARGGEASGEPVTVLVGSARINNDAKTATLTPLDFSSVSLESALAGGFGSKKGARL